MFYGRYYYIITVKEGSIPSRPTMRLQPLTLIFIGLFCCSLGLNMIQIKDYLKSIESNNKTIIIILKYNDNYSPFFEGGKDFLTQK